MIPNLVADLVILGACYIVACRIDKMEAGVTKPIVFLQHAVLGVGMFASLVLSVSPLEDWATAALAVGILGFFLLSTGRWKDGAPEGTTKPAPLDDSLLRHVSGGRRDEP